MRPIVIARNIEVRYDDGKCVRAVFWNLYFLDKQKIRFNDDDATVTNNK